jgi:hypothetical protein
VGPGAMGSRLARWDRYGGGAATAIAAGCQQRWMEMMDSGDDGGGRDTRERRGLQRQSGRRGLAGDAAVAAAAVGGTAVRTRHRTDRRRTDDGQTDGEQLSI